MRESREDKANIGIPTEDKEHCGDTHTNNGCSFCRVVEHNMDARQKTILSLIHHPPFENMCTAQGVFGQ